MTRVLVVEDEPGIALGLEDDLRLEGYDVLLARDGISATKLALEEKFDLILLDVMLPGRNGFEVCREIRRRGVSSPIIMLTAKAQEEEKVMGLELGADDYMTKPFSPAELRARIKSVLRRSSSDTLSAYRFGDIEADFVRFEIRNAGRPVHVTPLEMKLLSALIRNRGRVMRRPQLMEAVWSGEAFMTDRVIDTHIANLRKKIEPDPAAPRYLVSVRGVGYRFDG